MMALGLFIFGLGVSPLAVVQESIIVRFFHSHGLGISMALGLVAGKTASFVAARTSYPLSQRFGPHAPFVVATTLSAISVGVNLVYISASRWIIKETETEMEAAELSDDARQFRIAQSLSEAEALEEVARKKRVHIWDITKLGDVFWAYVTLSYAISLLETVSVILGSTFYPAPFGSLFIISPREYTASFPSSISQRSPQKHN
jgi:hypothetical protein